MKIEVFSDGSGNTFNSDGGYGWRLVIDGTLFSEGNGYIASATNNVAEITAAIEGLKAAVSYTSNLPIPPPSPIEVVLISDSQLVLGYATGRYQCKALHLTQLYIQLRSIYGVAKATTKWVAGHSGNTHNEACDILAGEARKTKGTTCLNGQRIIKSISKNIKDNTDLKTEQKDFNRRKSGEKTIKKDKKQD